MRALVALLPLAAARDVTVTILTCHDRDHSQSGAGSRISGRFTTGCDGACPAAQTLVDDANTGTGESGERRQGKADSYTFQQSAAPGCFQITTTSSDGWKFCFVEVAAPEGTWTWSGHQWVDSPCTRCTGYGSSRRCFYNGNEACTPQWTNCDWTHVDAPPPTVSVRDHECSYQSANLGRPATPAACQELAKAQGCASEHFMFSHSYGYSWGCRCCSSSAAGIQHNLWNVYSFGVAAAGVSGDPFVSYKGKSTQVWLPLEKEISLMQCDAATPWELRGTAFGSGVNGDSKQWFRSLALRVGGAEQFRVEAKDTLAVTSLQGFFNYTVARETITVTAPGTSLEFTSASAKDVAVGRHVDIKILQLKESACRGALPEIWGLVPMTEKTAALLLPPSQ